MFVCVCIYVSIMHAFVLAAIIAQRSQTSTLIKQYYTHYLFFCFFCCQVNEDGKPEGHKILKSEGVSGDPSPIDLTV